MRSSSRDYRYPQHDYARRDDRCYDRNERNCVMDYSRRPPPENRGYEIENNVFLNDMKGRVAENVKAALGRDTLLRNFTGKPHHHWVIQELIECMDALCQYKAGIEFLAKLNDKMEYKSHGWCDAIFRNFERMVTEEAGCSLLSSVVSYAPDHYLAPLVRLVFRKFQTMTENDENLMRLVCSVLQVIGDAPIEYQLFLNLQLYISRPYAAPAGAVILEYGDERAIEGFQNEIIANVHQLVQSEKLVVLVSACLIRGPRDVRNRIIPQLEPHYYTLVKQPWSWKLIIDVLSVGVMLQKEFCAKKMLELALRSETPTYMDKILVHALQSVSSAIRTTMLGDAKKVASFGCFPQLARFITS